MLAVKGRRAKRLPSKPEWYCCRCKVAIQVEGQGKGNQGLEERFVLVVGTDFGKAERLLRKNWGDYSEPYLNSNGEAVRWHLEEVVDVYHVGSLELDPQGTEVFSSLRERRMKPEFEWHPAKQ